MLLVARFAVKLIWSLMGALIQMIGRKERQKRISTALICGENGTSGLSNRFCEWRL